MTKTAIVVGTKVRLNHNFIPSDMRGVETHVTRVDGDDFWVYDPKNPQSGDWYAFARELDVIKPVAKPKPKKAPKPKAANTKIAKLRSHFLSGRSLTQLEAIGLYGAFRLAARVHELKGDGMKIVTRMKEDPNGNPYAEYQLRSPWVKG